jgi:streptogramin lyase
LTTSTKVLCIHHDIPQYPGGKDDESTRYGRAVRAYPLPQDRGNVNLNTATFDARGILWFTGQNGIYGRLDSKRGSVDVFDAPKSSGPYGMATTPGG